MFGRPPGWPELVLISGILLYFLPTIITLIRRKHNRLPIILLNIFAGWTFIGWIVALVWGAMKEGNTETKEIIESQVTAEPKATSEPQIGEEICPHCNKPSLVTRDRCEHCGMNKR